MVKDTAMKYLLTAIVGTLLPLMVMAQDAKVSDFYTLDSLEVPEGEVIEVGSIEWMPDGRLAVGSRRGEIWMVHNSLKGLDGVEWKRYAHGMHQLLGLSYNKKDKYLYATQRGEITKVNDRDGDGVADEFRTFCDDWGVSGDYHEYVFGTKFDKDGYMYIVLCLTGSGGANKDTPYRGWAMRITPEGVAEPFCGGIRSPGGIGFDAQERVFYGDNQGPWNGTSSVKHLKQGSFQGNPTGNIWYKRAPKLKEPVKHESGGRIVTAAKAMKEYVPPTAQLTHGVLGNSTSGMVADTTGGKFGPFTGQLFVYDQSHSNIVRLHIEEVNGVLQSAAFMFMESGEGFGSGNLVGVFAPDGSMFVGGTNRGWGSRGKKTGAVDRIRWTGKVPFEPYSMSAKPDGFEIAYTKPIDKASAENLAGWSMEAHTYIYQSKYGSPVVDKSQPKITGVKVIDDKTVRVTVDALIQGHIHTLKMEGLRSKDGEKLLHNTGYYTLNEIPAK
jgi:glucose/arabinose dehydrogenase